MAQILMRALRLLEVLDFYGQLTVTELATHLGVDKATASRMVRACTKDGWVVRRDGKVALGPRAALLGQGEQAAYAVRAAEPIVQTLWGVSGLLSQAVTLVGSDIVVLASAGTVTGPRAFGLTTRMPLWASAAGKTIAAQLPPSQLDDLLPAEPFPDPLGSFGEIASPAWTDGIPPAAKRTGETTFTSRRADFDEQLDGIRREQVFIDIAELSDETTCIAVPWPRPGVVAALVCVSFSIDVRTRRAQLERLLRAAAAPGANRETIVAAAGAND